MSSTVLTFSLSSNNLVIFELSKSTVWAASFPDPGFPLGNLLMRSEEKGGCNKECAISTVTPFALERKSSLTSSSVLMALGLASVLYSTLGHSEYCGFSSFDLRITSADVRYLKLLDLAGHGATAFLGDGKSFNVQRNSYGKLNIITYSRKDESWADQFKGLESTVLKEKIVEEFPAFHDEILDFIRPANDDIVLRKLYALPFSCYNLPKTHPSLTLLGDAAHLMSPFAGEGVNLAMADATDLASQLSLFLSSRSQPDSKVTLTDVLDVFQKEMFKRALPPGQTAARNIEFFHNSDVDGAVDSFKSFVAVLECLQVTVDPRES